MSLPYLTWPPKTGPAVVIDCWQQKGVKDDKTAIPTRVEIQQDKGWTSQRHAGMRGLRTRRITAGGKSMAG